MKITKQLLVLALLLSSSVAMLAQNAMTPYSRYGYGILQDNATSTQRAMGGVGYAMSSGRQINVMNPASYASIDSLTFLFDMGIGATALWSEENGRSGKDFGGGLDYITMQFPISKYMGQVWVYCHSHQWDIHLVMKLCMVRMLMKEAVV